MSVSSPQTQAVGKWVFVPRLRPRTLLWYQGNIYFGSVQEPGVSQALLFSVPSCPFSAPLVFTPPLFLRDPCATDYANPFTGRWFVRRVYVQKTQRASTVNIHLLTADFVV
ncbi:unnamed protein product [Ectocarpus sp. 12 AP-2014]